MMPITSVGRESRGVETEHRANLSGAQGGNQAIEARSFDGATCSTTEIVVDHFDIGEAASTCGHQIPVACRSRHRPPRSAYLTVSESSTGGLQGIRKPRRMRRRG